MNPNVGILVGAVFTVMILSYLLGDNFLFRLATHVLIGGVAAYVTVTVFADVLVKRIWEPVVQRGDLAAIIVAGVGLIFGAMLLLKSAPQLAWIGNIPIGYLLGVGAAVALGGALFGTLGPQVVATATPAPLFNAGIFDGRTLLLNGLILFVTATTLMSFGFNRVARGGILSGVNSIGRFFLAIALGATFALVYVASVTLLVDRVQGISDAINLFIPPP
jgi:hypothetical protein